MCTPALLLTERLMARETTELTETTAIAEGVDQ
jgi:hypothetical protein